MSPLPRPFRSMLPEILLIAVACLQFLIGPFLFTEGPAGHRRLGRTWAVISLLALCGAIVDLRPAPQSSATFAADRSERFFGLVRPRRCDSGRNCARADQLGRTWSTHYPPSFTECSC